jgi:hypothetical protein
MRIESGSQHVAPSIPWQTKAPRKPNGQEFTPQESEKLKKLEERDLEVRRHEEAHRAAAGQYAIGGPKYEFETGPDQKRYAVGGEVKIDTSPVRDDPEATIRKAEQVKRAAMAPADPSSEDHRIAAEAEKMKAEAQREIAEREREEMKSAAKTSRNAEANEAQKPAPEDEAKEERVDYFA